MITVLDSGVVYRNPKPYLRAVNAWHPTIVRLDDGELVAAFDLGQGPESLDYRTWISRSRDDGKTWTSPVRMFEDPVTNRSSSHSARISRMPDGSLVAAGGRFYRDDPEQGLVNHENLGYVPMDLILLRSRDGGHTWKTPETIKPPLIGPSFEICHPVIALSDGRWLLPTSTWKAWNGDAPNGMQCIGLVSYDRGATWPEYLPIFNAYDRGVVSWESSVVELSGGKLAAVAWSLNESSGETEPTPCSVAVNGRTFSPPRATGLHGQTAKLLALSDDRILCAYRRNDKPGLWANLSRLEGPDNEWVNLAEAPLWQGARSQAQWEGRAGDELSALKFGFPSLIQLPNNEVFVVFWCLEECLYNIRWVRLSVK